MQTPEEVVREYFAALSSGDLQRTLAVFSTDAAVMADGFDTTVGLDALRNMYDQIFGRARIDETPRIERALQSDGLAVVRTSSSGTIKQLESGTTSEVAFREVFALQQSSEGWRIAEYMFNSQPAS